MLKTVSSVTNAIGALNYKGTWNASTNTPTLVSSVGTKGDYYVVSVAGSTNLDGETLWGVGDWVVFNGSIWQKVDGGDTSTVTSLTVTTLTGYMYANNTSPVTASTTIPVANVTGAVPNTVNVLSSGLLSGGGALTGNVTLSLTSVPVANVPGAVPNTVNVLAGTGMSGGGALTGNVTLNLANTAVTAGTYGNATAVASFTVDQQGRLTNVGNVTIAISNSAVSGLGTMSTQNANAVAITGGTVNGITGNIVGAIPNGSITNVLLQNSTATLGNATITLGSTTSTVGNLTLSNVTVSSGNVTANVSLTNATNASATFATSSLPLVPAGYLKFQLANSTVVLVPYYAQ